MSKSILISIKPKWLAKILNGEKTIEVRKTMPKCDIPIDVYIYCGKEKPYLFESDWSDNKGRCCVVPTELKKAIEYVKSKPHYGKEQNGCPFVLYGTPYGNLFEKRKYYSGKVVAKFTLGKVEEIKFTEYEWYGTKETPSLKVLDKSCLSLEGITTYLKNKNGKGYAWHIDNLVIFDKPKELSEFFPYCKDTKCEYRKNHCSICHREPLTKAPQSWCYIESEEER